MMRKYTLVDGMHGFRHLDGRPQNQSQSKADDISNNGKSTCSTSHARKQECNQPWCTHEKRKARNLFLSLRAVLVTARDGGLTRRENFLHVAARLYRDGERGRNYAKFVVDTAPDDRGFLRFGVLLWLAKGWQRVDELSVG